MVGCDDVYGMIDIFLLHRKMVCGGRVEVKYFELAQG